MMNQPSKIPGAPTPNTATPADPVVKPENKPELQSVPVKTDKPEEKANSKPADAPSKDGSKSA